METRSLMAPPANLEQLLEPRVYPGMIAAESRVLRAWLALHGAAYDEILFETRVGVGAQLPASVPERDRQWWAERTKLRPDVICWRAPNVADIVEVKETADNSAIWQVLSYRDAYVAAFPDRHTRPLIVCSAITDQARQVAIGQRITVHVMRFRSADLLAPADEPATS